MNLLPPMQALLSRIEQRTSCLLRSVRVCGLQHILPSQEHLFGAVSSTRLCVGKPAIIGKLYSTVPAALPTQNYLSIEPRHVEFRRGFFSDAFRSKLGSVCHELAPTVDNGGRTPVVIVDDGGFVGEYFTRFFRNAGCPIAVVEQTTAGVGQAMRCKVPGVIVASSAVKRSVESKLIAESVLRSLVLRGVLPNQKCWGIVGCGAVGLSLIKQLARSQAGEVLVYDRSNESLQSLPKGVTVVASLEELISRSNVLLGCTGSDFADGVDLKTIKHHGTVVCASCGSSDQEFRSWMYEAELVKFRSAFDKYFGSFQKGSYQILNGGFPVNLDRRTKSDPLDDYILTRMLMLVGIVQAAERLACDDNRSVPDPLDPELQRIVMDEWFKFRPKVAREIPDVNSTLLNATWIEAHSQIPPRLMATAM